MKHGNFILEACVDSPESAAAAQIGGADRLELCGHLIIGGVTPDEWLFRKVKEVCELPVRVLIRPRFGDFCYTDYEFELMKMQVRHFRELGADAVVIGCLQPDGSLDMQRMEHLVDLAGNMEVTLHRAFDVCRDPYEALEQAIELGIGTILTSGQESSCMKGQECLKKLQQQSNGRITLMAGAGVNADVIEALYRSTGLRAYHMSGKRTGDSVMQYRREGVPMGLPGISEYEIWRTDAAEIQRAAAVMSKFPKK
ncbi:MAG: copper homeostasis protein CutC [Lachnospiraceae bacterium]|nr:copper homeostasis protein CutC [Lachnospiraceae bacterium]